MSQPVLRAANGTFYVVRASRAAAESERLGAEIVPSAMACWMLEEWLIHPSASRELSRLAHELLGSTFGTRTPSDLHRGRGQGLTERLGRGDLVLLQQRPRPISMPRPNPIAVLGPAPEVEDKPWFDLFVVADDDESPIAGVKVVVRRPDGKEIDCTTDDAGKISIDPTRSGACRVVADVRDLRFGDALEVLSAGRGDPPRGDANDGSRSAPPRRLASIARHRVRSGESLDGLARGAGMSWEELALFNFDTDDPTKVNQRLRSRVGCRRRTTDGKNLVFSDADSPGIVYIPRKFVEDGLRTESTHVIRARRLARPERVFCFSV